MSRKLELLEILAGKICPICMGEKIPQGWTCLACGKKYRESNEHAVLAWACQQHLMAAEKYLTMVREREA